VCLFTGKVPSLCFGKLIKSLLIWFLFLHFFFFIDR
jgi:hypothetical protein